MKQSPTPSTDRILHLDIFRGFAILGIFMVNILVMNTSFLYRDNWLIDHASWINESAYWFLEMFFFSKFFPIFSFLFGIGVALQIRSLRNKMSSSTLFLIRRFTALLIFGLAHILFIWSGDILHLYALFGFVLMLMYRTPPYVILLSVIIIFTFPYFDEIFEYIISYLDVNPSEGLPNLTREDVALLKVKGSYTSGISLRITEYGFFMPVLVSFIIPFALAMTLLGLYIVKKGIIDRIDAFVNKIRTPFAIIFVLSMAYRFTYYYWIRTAFEIEFGSALSFTLITLYFLTEVMISFVYLIIIVHILRSKVGVKLLSPLKYVGRMALTNYIMQSVIGYLIMRTFGYFESFSASYCILIVLTVFACQIPLSWFWLKHFKFGPLEWLWRCISYWKVLPIRK
ncbi:MAG: DUF418 domain-containing protein [Crocinitomicaceae bacterium]|nr:DUF418 domain-containing protein [Crocinitomicaceae bacterium]